MGKQERKKPLLSVSITVTENRKARFEYHLEETFEAGIVLTGTEVKSLRHGLGSIGESFAESRAGELWLLGAHIPTYTKAGTHLQHDPKRDRKLLLRRKDINRLMGATTREGYTVVPTRLYFNAKGLAKIQLALAKGKKLHDKRDTQKERDWSREKRRLLTDKR